MKYKILKNIQVFFKTKKSVFFNVELVLVDCLRGKIKAVKVKNRGFFYWDDLMFDKERLVVLTENPQETAEDKNLADILGFKVLTLNDQELGILEDYDFNETSGKILQYFIKTSLLKKLVEGNLILNHQDIIRIKPEKKEIFVRDLEDKEKIRIFKIDKAQAMGAV